MSCLQQLLKEAENLGWFTRTDGNFTSFEIYSPENQDFYFEVEHMGSVERLIDGIKVIMTPLIALQNPIYG